MIESDVRLYTVGEQRCDDSVIKVHSGLQTQLDKLSQLLKAATLRSCIVLLLLIERLCRTEEGRQQQQRRAAQVLGALTGLVDLPGAVGEEPGPGEGEPEVADAQRAEQCNVLHRAGATIFTAG